MVRTRSGILVATLVAAAACGGSDSTEPETPRATGINVTPATVTLTFLGQTQALTGRILDQNGATFQGTLTWSSDDATVVSVTASGTVTAVAAGATTVRATYQSLSATVAVTVSQTPAALTVLSGDGQQAFQGEPLADEVVARVEDQGGSGVPGVAVTFAPGAGSVDPATATTDAEGRASTTWTMGEALGPQTLTVSAGTLTTVVGATSLSSTPIPDLVTGGVLVLDRADPSTLETVTAQATVRNDGNASSGAFRVRITGNGTELEAAQITDLAPDASQTVTFTVGPFPVGSRTLRVEVDPDGAVDESNEANNTVDKAISVVRQTVAEPGQTLSGLVAADSVELLYRIELAAPASNLTIETSGGVGDLDLYVEGGVRPSHRDLYEDCVSGNSTNEERCQVNAQAQTVFHVLLFAWDEFSGATMKVILDGEVVPYNIELVFVDNGTASQDQAVESAAERWMELVIADVSDIDFANQAVPANTCTEGQPEITDVIDDLRIYVRISEIDGPGQTLAQAGPCITRGLGKLPVVGIMEFDAADLEQLEADGDMVEVVLHEMGHVIGIGTRWGPTAKDLLRIPSLPSSPGVDTHFIGELAIAAFDAAGGTSYTGGQKVPVENNANAGSADAHWRESVLRRELMTPGLNSGFDNPLSAISVQSLADLGYIVDTSKADPYTQSFSAPPRTDEAERPLIDLSGDLRTGPVLEVDGKGRVIRRR